MIRFSLLFFAMLTASTISLADKPNKNGKAKERPVYVIGPGLVKKDPECALISPEKVYERMSHISDTRFVCYSDELEYAQHIAFDGNDAVQFEIGFEDLLDGSGLWYGYVFEYDPSAEDALDALIFREDLTVDEVQACRAAFEPPFLCDGP